MHLKWELPGISPGGTIAVEAPDRRQRYAAFLPAFRKQLMASKNFYPGETPHLGRNLRQDPEKVLAAKYELGTQPA